MRTSRLALIGLAMMAFLAWASVARADLDAVAQAMGVSKVDSVQIAGGGSAYAVGHRRARGGRLLPARPSGDLAGHAPLDRSR